MSEPAPDYRWSYLIHGGTRDGLYTCVNGWVGNWLDVPADVGAEHDTPGAFIERYVVIRKGTVLLHGILQFIKCWENDENGRPPAGI